MNNPQSCTLAQAKDFYDQINSNPVVTINNVAGTFTGTSSGTAIILAIHKTTGTSYSFNVKVNKNAIIIVPGMMGSELTAGENHADFEYGTVLWSSSLISEISSDSLSELEVAQRIISLRCDSKCGDFIHIPRE